MSPSRLSVRVLLKAMAISPLALLAPLSAHALPSCGACVAPPPPAPHAQINTCLACHTATVVTPPVVTPPVVTPPVVTPPVVTPPVVTPPVVTPPVVTPPVVTPPVVTPPVVTPPVVTPPVVTPPVVKPPVVTPPVTNPPKVKPARHMHDDDHQGHRATAPGTATGTNPVKAPRHDD